MQAHVYTKKRAELLGLAVAAIMDNNDERMPEIRKLHAVQQDFKKFADQVIHMWCLVLAASQIS